MKTKKNKKQVKKNKKKGFTLVELLAVIIILAIVVGITIPAVMTTTNGAKSKAFATAANTLSDWIDREYQIHANGISDIQAVDATFTKNFITNSYISATTSVSAKRYVLVDAALLEAGGLKPNNFIIYTSVAIKTAGTATDNVTSGSAITAYVTDTSAFAKSIVPYSSVYIDSAKGRSCVRLVAKSKGDYDTNTAAGQYEVECGGICGTTTSDGNYCVKGTIKCPSDKAKCTFSPA